jgi:hypothetical protein
MEEAVKLKLVEFLSALMLWVTVATSQQMGNQTGKEPARRAEVVLLGTGEVAAKFPEECRYVLETLGAVYQQESFCREQGVSPEERLGYHQSHSGPRMKELEQWFREQFAERKVEPNSGLGQAITYMQNHWAKLTLFLRQAGAPLDNNLCERALKKAILHRKKALFYKTQNGAHVGDLIMSLIHICQFCDANPFHYLTALQEHSELVARSPRQWMPWNYRETRAQELGL